MNESRQYIRFTYQKEILNFFLLSLFFFYQKLPFIDYIKIKKKKKKKKDTRVLLTLTGHKKKKKIDFILIEIYVQSFLYFTLLFRFTFHKVERWLQMTLLLPCNP
ncbi:hypothetical protein HMI56_001273 [Coelomomyces lativittatus]|nr:hypothetical protein HMI56_001273 [Coelomomyces lativittatus]